MKGICYLICAGESVPLTFVPGSDDLVIAVDGGWKFLETAGIRADVALGDFDSLGGVPPAPEVISFDAVKDVTDTFAAAEEGLKRGYTEFRIYCALGGRLSHTLANLHTLTFLRQRGAHARLIGNDCEIFMIDGRAEFSAGGYLSLIPVGGNAEVKIENCKYRGVFSLTPADSLGVSNEPLDGASVTALSGNVLAVLERK